MGNPVHVVSLVYRVRRILPGVLDSLSQCDLRREVEFVKKIMKSINVTEDDLVGVMKSLLRIQYTYRLYLYYYDGNFLNENSSFDPLDLSKGLIGDQQTEAKLSFRKELCHSRVISLSLSKISFKFSFDRSVWPELFISWQSDQRHRLTVPGGGQLRPRH